MILPPQYLALFIFLTLCCASNQTPAPDATADRPNILLIMTDDQGWGDLGIHGNDSIRTPHLDRLGSQSVRFEHFYVSPVCAPTRASLLTGRYHLRTGTSWVTHRKEVMRPSEVTISEYLKQNGYRTGIFGKWHNGHQYPTDPLGQGFDEFLGFKAGHWNNYFDPTLVHQDETIKSDGYISDVFTDAAIQWMDDSTEQPFFCYLPYNAPHGPFQVPDRYFDYYKSIGLNDKNAAVYGMVENIDDNVGRLLQFLEEKQISDNTIVIFMTDNGPNGHRYNGGMRGVKASNHEGGMRVPFFIKWGNRLPTNKVVQPIAAHIDILPTLLELCNIEYTTKKPLDGRSLVPLLREDTPEWPERQLFQIQSDGKLSILHSAMRNEQHRFVINRDSSMQLFDMKKDPGQKDNIIDLHPELAAQYLSDLQNWFADVISEGIEAPPVTIDQRPGQWSNLLASDAYLKGKLVFQGKMGWANDYIINWNHSQDSVQWPVYSDAAGNYDVHLEYVAQEEAVGSTYQITSPAASISGRIEEAYYPHFLASPDRIPRGEVYERIWKKESVGVLQLEKGEQLLTIHPLDIPGGTFIELKAIHLQKQK